MTVGLRICFSAALFFLLSIPIRLSAQTLHSGNNPFAFVENIGQWRTGLQFEGRHGATLISIEPDGVGLAFSVRETRIEGLPSRTHTLRTRFVGSNPNVRTVGEGLRRERYNYYFGANGGNHTGARAFDRVRYRNLYNGIDAIYKEDQGRLKYDFIVAPGADAADIRLRYEGATGMSIDRSGHLVVSTPFGWVREDPPVCYQQTRSGRRSVRSRYRLLGNRTYGFEIGEYDNQLPLVIDPCLSVQYSTYLGGGGFDVVASLAVDSLGNAYATGLTRSPNFPQVPSGANLDGETYVFISKLSADGTRLIYSTVLGRSYDGPYIGTQSLQSYESIGIDVEVSRADEAVVAFTSNIDNLATTSGAWRRELTPDNISSFCGPPAFRNFDVYIARLTPTGELSWGSYLGGMENDYLRDLALDASGNPVVAGITYAPTCGSGGAITDTLSYPTTLTGQLNTTDKSKGLETFITVMAADGRSLRYSALYGGAEDDIAGRVGVDAAGRIVIVGSTNSNNLPTTPGSYQPAPPPGASASTFDLFVARFDPSATSLNYGTYIGDVGPLRSGLGVGGLKVRQGIASLGGFENHALRQGLVVPPVGEEIIIAGTTVSSGAPTTPGAFQRNVRGGSDCFIMRFDIAASQIPAAGYIGGNRDDQLGGVTVDRFGDIAVAFSTASNDLPITAVSIQDQLRGAADAAVVTITPDLSRITYATYLGGSTRSNPALPEHTVYGITADTYGALYLYGGTASRDIPVTQDAVIRNNDYFGGYIFKFAAPTLASIGTGLAVVFEPNTCGDPQFRPLKLFNAGQSPLRIDSLYFDGSQAFSLTSQPFLPLVLAPCDTTTLIIRFDGNKLACKQIASANLVIVAPDAAVPRVRVPVNGSRTCLYFTVQNKSVNYDYKLGSGLPIGFEIYVNGSLPQYATVRPDPSNKGYFTPAFPDSNVYPQGTSALSFNTHFSDTGVYCETFYLTVQPCNRVDTLRICVRAKTGIFRSDSLIDFGLLSCREIFHPIVVRNVGNDTLLIRISYTDRRDSLDITFEPSQDFLQKIAPSDSIAFPMYIRPRGTGSRQARVIFYTDEGRRGIGRYVEIRYELDSIAFRLHTPSSPVIGGFGDTVEIPVEYEPIVEGRVGLEEFTFRLLFDPKLLAVAGIATNATATSGWEMVRKVHTDSGAVVVIRNVSGSAVVGPQSLVRLQMRVLRGDTIASPLDVAIAGVTAGCAYTEVDSGRVFQLNAECAAAERLLYEGRRLLKPITPNPARNGATVVYRLPWHGHTTITIYDINGREVLRPVDTDLAAGHGEWRLEPNVLPAGLYYVRLTLAGGLAETQIIMIEQ